MAPNRAPQLTFDSHRRVTVGTISESNMLDAMNVTEFGNEVLEFIKDKPGLQLLLNFEHVDYMSSAALTELLRINEALRTTAGSVRLCGLSKDIRKVFQITNLEKLFVIHEDETADLALKRFVRALEIAQEEKSWAGHSAGN
ncbi:MAG: STAS domain-containing protein [Candidatus Hydrogenedentota bacterium]